MLLLTYTETAGRKYEAEIRLVTMTIVNSGVQESLDDEC